MKAGEFYSRCCEAEMSKPEFDNTGICPYCKDHCVIEEIHECALCEELYFLDEVKSGLCPNCKAELPKVQP